MTQTIYSLVSTGLLLLLTTVFLSVFALFEPLSDAQRLFAQVVLSVLGIASLVGAAWLMVQSRRS